MERQNTNIIRPLRPTPHSITDFRRNLYPLSRSAVSDTLRFYARPAINLTHDVPERACHHEQDHR